MNRNACKRKENVLIIIWILHSQTVTFSNMVEIQFMLLTNCLYITLGWVIYTNCVVVKCLYKYNFVLFIGKLNDSNLSLVDWKSSVKPFQVAFFKFKLNLESFNYCS